MKQIIKTELETMVKELKTMDEVEEFENENFGGCETEVVSGNGRVITRYLSDIEKREYAGWKEEYTTIDNEGIKRNHIIFSIEADDRREIVIARYVKKW